VRVNPKTVANSVRPAATRASLDRRLTTSLRAG